MLLLLQELTDSDVLSEREEASVIIDAIVDKQVCARVLPTAVRLHYYEPTETHALHSSVRQPVSRIAVSVSVTTDGAFVGQSVYTTRHMLRTSYFG